MQSSPASAIVLYSQYTKLQHSRLSNSGVKIACKQAMKKRGLKNGLFSLDQNVLQTIVCHHLLFLVDEIHADIAPSLVEGLLAH